MEEIKEVETAETEKEPAETKVGFKNKLILLVIFSVLLGFVIKTEAVKRVTVGFEDYKLQGVEKTYNINQLQKGLEKKQAAQAKQGNIAPTDNSAQPDDSSGSGGGSTCSAGSGENCSQ